MKNLKNVGGRWLVDIEIQGERRRLTFLTKTEAEFALTELRHQREMNKLGLDVPTTKSRDLLFKDFAEKVVASQEHLRANTKKGTQSCLNAILGSDLFRGKRLSDVKTENIADYHAARGSAGGRCAANADLGLLRRIFARAVEYGELKRNPTTPVKPFRIELTKFRFLSDAEALLLTNACGPELLPLVRLLLTTGMRPHEAFALYWPHDGWDTENKLCTAIVDLEKKAIFIPGLLAKNHKDRSVPLSPELVEMFKGLRRAATTDKVFPWNDCPNKFREAVKAAGLKNVTIYTLKHSAISRMLKAGAPIIAVAKVVGHSDIKQTMRYAHSDAVDEQDAIAKVSRIYFQSAPVVDAPAAAARADRRTEGTVS
jgi:integrase